ncbi:LysR family transcriptional regulator [Consotaella aegiceratis]|uniref:LysR family transcriptional regulator n=1 Tax=Consotaella aegiceratis TaxID=3097961 RepID=UPI002F3F1ADC
MGRLDRKQAEFNLRHLRAFSTVVEEGSLTRAATICAVSQPAITQAVGKLEAQLEEPLLERTSSGVFTTDIGRVFLDRVNRALARLDSAFAVMAPRLRLTATIAQLEALIAVRETGNFTLAARRMGLAQPTVHRAVARLEKEAVRPLFARESRGLVPTRAGEALAVAARLAFAELAQARMEVAELRGRDAGRIVIGALPLSRAYRLPAAIVRFRQSWPNMPLRIVTGSYSELLKELRSGEIDFIIGALRDPLPINDVEQRSLFDDELAIVASPRHPLATKAHVEIADLVRYAWVVAASGIPTRMHFDRIVASAAESPLSIIETSSMILMREILIASDHLGCVSRHQAQAEVRSGALVILPINLDGTARRIGITTRTGWKPTRSQADFLDILDALDEA